MASRRGATDRELPPGPARDLVALFQELQFAAQLSNGQIAISTGLSRSHVSEVMRGRKAPSPEAATRIAEALGANAHAARSVYVLAERLAEWNQYERSRSRDSAKIAVATPSAPTVASREARSMGLERFGRVFNPYVRKARMEPVLLVVLPPCLLALVTVPVSPTWIMLFVLLAFALPAMVDHVAREQGRRLEPILFAAWGGKPTNQLLRWTGPLSRQQQALTRASVQRIVGQWLTLPSEAEERADPAAADDVYDAAVTVLRVVARRGHDDRGLIFEENCQYGFRRNCLGLRLFGIIMSVATVMGAAAVAVVSLRGGHTLSVLPLFVGLIAVAFLWFWTFVVRPRWVELAAWSYAHRLIESATHTDVEGASE